MEKTAGTVVAILTVLYLTWIEFDLAAVVWAIVAAIAIEFLKDPA